MLLNVICIIWSSWMFKTKCLTDAILGFSLCVSVTFTATTILDIWSHLPDYFHSNYHLGYLVTSTRLLSQQPPSWIFGHMFRITFTAATILDIWSHAPDYFHSSHHLGYLVTCSGLDSQQPPSWIFGHGFRITFTAAFILDIWSLVPD